MAIAPRRTSADTSSVVMTVRNAELFIGEAIDSVIAQTHRPDEIIVNDDGSTDGTLAVLATYGPTLTVLTGPPAGTSAGRNRALAAATGAVVLLLDADDVWLAPKVERQLTLLQADPALDAVFCATDEFVDERGGPADTRAPRLGAVGPLPSALAIRRRVVDRVGPFRTEVSAGDWIDWWGRALALGVRWHDQPEVLLRRRLHATNSSADQADNADAYLRIVRDRLAARRAHR